MNENELSLEVRKITAAEIQVFDQSSYADAGELLVALKSRAKQVREYWSEPKRKADEAHKAVCAKEREMLDPLDAAERTVKRKMAEYLEIEERRRRAEEERQRVEAEKMMALAAESEEAGEPEMAAEAIIESELVSSNVAAPPKAAGVSSKKVWKFRILDPLAVPEQYKMVNEQLIAAIAKGFKDAVTLPIPGIEFYQESVISARTK